MNPMTAQQELEQLFHKNQTLPRLRAEFRIPELVSHIERAEIPVDFAIDLMCQMVLHKRAVPGVLVGILQHHFKDQEKPLQACADMLVRAAQADLVDYDDMRGQFIIRVDVTQDVYDDLERYQYPLPLIIPPREVQTNSDTGYHFAGAKGSLILKGGNHHEDDICLDHINRLNRTRLTVNMDTARMVQNQWNDLDTQKPDETKEEHQKRIAAFEKYDKNARDVMEHLFVAGDIFWLTHKYDKRGRTYAQGYHVNPQGNDWNKAVVEFADQEIVHG